MLDCPACRGLRGEFDFLTDAAIHAYCAEAVQNRPWFEGCSVNIRARSGVVMACDGHENDRRFMQDFVPVADPYPIAAVFNTGGGHRMCMKAGAQMSAMHNAMMYINRLFDDQETAEWDSGTRVGKAQYTTSLLFVGTDGTRFMNENFKARHGYEPWHGNFRKQAIPAHA